jgi:hypothetical protein
MNRCVTAVQRMASRRPRRGLRPRAYLCAAAHHHAVIVNVHLRLQLSVRLAKKVQLVDPTIRGVINYQLKFQLLESGHHQYPSLGPGFPPRILSDPVRSRQIPSDPPI